MGDLLARPGCSGNALWACLDRKAFSTFVDGALAKAASGETTLEEVARMAVA